MYTVLIYNGGIVAEANRILPSFLVEAVASSNVQAIVSIASSQCVF